MKPIKKAVATIGKYTKDGQEKNRYLNVGTLMQREDGSLAMKLDALPLGEFNGWINFYDLESNRQQQNEAGMAQARQAAAPSVPEGFDDTDIPF